LEREREPTNRSPDVGADVQWPDVCGPVRVKIVTLPAVTVIGSVVPSGLQVWPP
jgi:hypothetical protein